MALLYQGQAVFKTGRKKAVSRFSTQLRFWMIFGHFGESVGYAEGYVGALPQTLPEN